MLEDIDNINANLVLIRRKQLSQPPNRLNLVSYTMKQRQEMAITLLSKSIEQWQKLFSP